MKKGISIFLVVAMLLTMGAAGVFAADSAIKVTVNGNQVAFDQAPINRDGMVFVPIRGILEAFGQKVDYDQNSRKVTAADPVTGMVTTIDLKTSKVTTVQDTVSREYEMVTAPVVLSGRTLIPVRSLSEIFCRDVTWVQASQTVAIKDYDGAGKALKAGSTNEVKSGELVSASVIQDPAREMVWRMHKNDNVISVSKKMSGSTANFVFKIELSEDADVDSDGICNDTVILDYVDPEGRILQQQKYTVKITDPVDSAAALKEGSAVDVKVGSYVKVTLKNNSSSTGYRWYPTSVPRGLEYVEKVDQKIEDQTAGDQMLGTPPDLNYVYKVTQAGTMTLKFDSMRDWGTPSAQTMTYTINAK